MPKRSTVLKELLRQRHWQTYATFCRQYDEAAREVEPALIGRWPSRGQFARWLSGDIKGVPHPDHCRVLEAMFGGLTVQELFAFPQRPRTSVIEPSNGGYETPNQPSIPAARRRSAGIPTQAGNPAPEAPAGPADPATPATSATSAVPANPGDRSPLDPTRATLEPFRPAAKPNLAGQFIHALHEEMAVTTEESARFVRGIHGGVDHDVLDQLGADVRQLATDYLARPPLLLFRPLSRLRAEVFNLLDRRQRPGLLPPLYAVAGRLCALLAHASADLGHSYAAETHTRTAWLCADLADDDSLRAYVRWVQSNVAFWDGEYRLAAQTANSGQRYATKGSNLLRLASQEARAWAACGEAVAAERALSVAASARDNEVPDDQAGVFRFDPGKAAYYASEVRLALGGENNARLAVRNANDALDLFAQAPQVQHSPEFVAAARLDLANAHLALSDLESAAGQLRTVLRLPVESRTQPIVGRVGAAGQTLRSPRFTHSALALELVDEIALFRAYPARRDLSEALD
jgi:hypothetical protein